LVADCATRGVVRIARFAGYPLPVADEIVEEIRRRIEGKPIREPHLGAGEAIVITEGSFSGFRRSFSPATGTSASSDFPYACDICRFAAIRELGAAMSERVPQLAN